MNVKRRISLLILGGCIAFCAVSPRVAHADVEGRMTLMKSELDSAGLDNSGPVHVEAGQSDQGITELRVSAFGKLQTLTSSQLAALAGRTFNSIGLSYSRGYPDAGGRSIYLLLCQGFSPGVKVVAVITVRERGPVRVDDTHTAGP